MKRSLTAPAVNLACANSGCTNTVERYSRGRQKRFCSDNCRIRAHRISLQAAQNLAPGDTANAPGDFPTKKAISLQAKSKSYRAHLTGGRPSTEAGSKDRSQPSRPN